MAFSHDYSMLCGSYPAYWVVGSKVSVEVWLSVGAWLYCRDNFTIDVMNVDPTKTQLNEVLMKDQKTSVRINKNDKLVVEVESIVEFEQIDQQKPEYLQQRIRDAQKQIENGQLSDGDSFFDALESGEFD
ncbi:MAG: hypothetical protein COA42_22505 [Alteromonadaceae bacterium]|nr:MAG: hypothetical protein COA42_22505 [Alteromonadaceae bacterium]